MPYRRRYRKRKRRKFFKRRFRKRRNKMSILKLRGPTLMPDAIMMKFTYRTNFEFDDTLNADYTSLKLNSLFNPASIGTPDNPTGFQQWGVFYNKFVVYSSRIYARPYYLNTTFNPYIVCVYPSDTAVPRPANPGDAREQRYVKWQFQNQTSAVSFNNIKNYISMKKLSGRKITDEDYSGDFTGVDPNILSYWTVQAFCLDSNDLLTQLAVDIGVSYFVKLYDPVNVISSDT